MVPLHARNLYVLGELAVETAARLYAGAFGEARSHAHSLWVQALAMRREIRAFVEEYAPEAQR